MNGRHRWPLGSAAGIAAIAACVALTANALALPLGLATSARAADDATTVIASYRARIPELMAEQGIPGLAVALVDGDQVLWTQGFGHVDGDGSAAVDADTLFSVQSMSKLFTATAVMRAVQDGRLALDEPIITYLPEFTVHSAFEDHPERKITLRMLLSHTAGFTHEAPIGNNDELDPGEFDEHVRSISDTWLRFPVGTGYAYSNLGIDVAGFILERTYGKPFAAVMRDLLLAPLGMTESSFDRDEIGAASNRALGHSRPIPSVPMFEPMMAAGGLYTSATDLARFLRFQLSDGTLDGQAVLDSALMTEMRTVPAPHAGAPAGYALGVTRHRWFAADNADLFNHGGGGFGWLSDLWWAPQLQIGIAVLTNSYDHHLQGDLALSILGDLVHEPGGVYHDRLLALPAQVGAAEPNGGFLPPDDLARRVTDLAMPPSGDQAVHWAGYAGEYKTAVWGAMNPWPPSERFYVEGGIPYFDSNDDGTVTRHHLTEVETGLFFAEDGEALDMRGQPPTWRNFELVRVSGPAAWQWALLGSVTLVAAWWLVAGLVSTIRGRRRGAPDAAPGASGSGQSLLYLATGTLTAAFGIATIALVTAIPGLVDSGFLGWLELPMAQRLALHLPLALAVAAGGLVTVTAIGWFRGSRRRAARWRDAALVVGGGVLTVQLSAWHLIGWGLT
jgi:CubicO group peptidase (beta-lactamase class C family)